MKHDTSHPTVILSGKENAVQNLSKLITLAEYRFVKARRVVIKSNVCGMFPPDIRLLERTVELFQPFAESIVFGETDSAMHSPEERLRQLGITDLASRHNVELKNLLKDQIVRKKVPHPHAMIEIPLPSSLFEDVVLVNVAGLGTHRTTGLTCALKNLFGLVAVRSKYSVLHPLGVDLVIADVYQVVKPDLNIVDAGSRVIVGTSALAVDVVAAEVKGINSLDVEHLVLAGKNLGISLEELEIEKITL